MVESKEHDKVIFWMSGSYSVKKLQVRRAIVKEKLGTLTDIRIEFQSSDTKVDIEDLLGQTMTLHLDTTSEIERKFSGHCVSVENLGLFDGYMQLVAEVRPWPWFLTQVRDNRIFQEKTTKEIITEVFGDHGFSDYEWRANAITNKRNYCVQYNETDFDFISRLMQEEGMTYWFNYKDSKAKMVIMDDGSSMTPVEGGADIEYRPRSDSVTGEYIAEFTQQRAVRTGKISLDDYQFVTPKAKLEVKAQEGTTAKHKHKSYEAYDVPGRYRKGDAADTGMGTKFAQARQDAKDTEAMQYRGAGNVPRIATGQTFKLTDHEASAYNKEYLISEAVHYLQTESDYKQDSKRRDLDLGPDPFPEEMAGDVYNCTFGAVLKTNPFRNERTIPWPEIPGLQTALVVGPSGEEIHTDEHGRIKVQFHWDRDGKKNDKSSCWVRVVTPWSGKNWGMIHIPRIGQEVVIQFEDGNPDRPICTGMLYNKDTMPPYTLPANQTQSGIKTNSSKGGGGFNELMFEDKKDEELVRFQAEKDYLGIIKNNADITIGLEKKAEGNLTQTIHNHKTETLLEGSHTFTVEKGDETYTINKGNQTLLIEEGNQTTTIGKGDQTFSIETGSQTIEIKKDKTQTIEGKHTKTITGNDATTVKTGNMTVNVSAGKIEMTAAQKIELKVGGSSIKIDPSGITIKGPMVKIQGDAMAEMKSPLTTVKADGMLTLKGSLTMIN
ncbi:type VI secretion system Vgr family protein [Actibacterium pelagium]|uniref:Type VI secretion system secreted protein VgrG n=1 Tax=Actibacterium pelagium TaxID=2029103 RepID=A0A917AIH6_9RHOB|nr:type VI secretion system tip protein TssI/VgrG [Actibacterium pelagium]GGE53888.1 hypothetical protein GCM10011517_21890 [Actibacterium pelagium]